MTARWVVDVVAPARNLSVNWEPISLLVKNDPPEDSPWFPANVFTHKLLRVMVAVKESEGNESARELYWQYGAVLHHDRAAGDVDLDDLLAGGPGRFLEGAGLSPDYATAFDDESLDAVIQDRMDEGLALTGQDVGTPLLAFDTPNGRTGIFGPVISRIPEGETGAELWDAMTTMATHEAFWELKRTRTEDPQFPARP